VKLKLTDRILAALSGLIILLIGLGLLVYGVGIFPFKLDLSFLTQPFVLWQRAVMVAAALLMSILGIHGIAMLFRNGRDHGFIAQHTEYGDLSISMSAMENMVKKCVDSHNELKVSNTRIQHARDGIIVSIRISLGNGVNIPLTVSALQKQIKQYITSCSGVDVKEVRVMVETNNAFSGNVCPAPDGTMAADADAASKAGEVVSSLHEAAQNAMPKEMPPEPKPEKKPLHQRLFRHEEKPQTLPQPPVAVPGTEAEHPEHDRETSAETQTQNATDAEKPTESGTVEPNETKQVE
jgi:uncharacterized alkaline shock family protein YloU